MRLSGSSGKSRGLWQESDTGLTARAMTATMSPEEGMTMRIPVVRCLYDGLGDIGPILEASSGQGEGAQHFPPRLDQVEVGGVFRLEHHLPARVRQHEQQHIGCVVAAQIVGDGVDPLDLVRYPALDLFEEGYPVASAPTRVGAGEGGSSGGTEGAEDVALAAPTIVDLLPGPGC